MTSSAETLLVSSASLRDPPMSAARPTRAQEIRDNRGGCGDLLKPAFPHADERGRLGRAKPAQEPVAGERCDLVEGAGFLEEVGSAGHDRELVRSCEARHRL